MKYSIRNSPWRKSAILLRLISHPRHRSIIDTLARGEQTFGHIVATIGLSEAITSQHLKKLRDHDLLVSRRNGAHVYYRVCDPLVLKVLQDLRHESVIG